MDGHFCYCHLIWIIFTSGNCHVQIYKSYMYGHFCFVAWLTKYWCKFWACWSKNKTENHITKVITTRWTTYVIIDKKTLTLILTVANVNICRPANEACAIALVETGTQANQFASAIDRASNITTFTENRAGKSFFFLKTQKRLVL